MDFFFNKRWNITSVDEWIQKFCKSNKNEDGRSAKTLAIFCNKEDAEKVLVETLRPVVGDIHSIKPFPNTIHKLMNMVKEECMILQLSVLVIREMFS